MHLTHDAGAGAHDPRYGWNTAAGIHGAPTLGYRRDGIMPTVAAALSVHGETLTATSGKGDRPPALHPLVQRLLDGLPVERRERFTGRCPEAVLLSRYLTAIDHARPEPVSRTPLSAAEARHALEGSKITTRHIREDGDPRHRGYAPPCRSCAALLDHFGVRTVGADAPGRS